jgi:hypothetical protein
MSTLKVSAIQDASGGNTATINSMTPTADSLQGFRNRIINGDMRIDQRNAGAATANTINGYVVDRWIVNQSTTGKVIAQQNAGSVTPPTGFANYLGITSQSAYSVGSGDYYLIGQAIEGYNIADLNWGTANAKTVTLSFWVRSSLTGTFGGSLGNNGTARSYLFTYTISAANTWEYKTVTVAGDTSGTWEKTTSTGLNVRFGLGVGSTYSGTAGSWFGSTYFSATGATSVVGTNGATFYITGVQLEVGSTATPFERRPYGIELSLCQRYYAKLGNGVQYASIGSGFTGTSTRALVTVPLHTVMRASPTASISNMAIGDWENYTTAVSTISATYATPDIVLLNITGSGFTAFRPCLFQLNTTAGYADFSSEL